MKVIAPQLIHFKQEITPYVQELKDCHHRILRVIVSEYDALLHSAPEIDASSANILAGIRNALDAMIFSTEHILDVVRSIGTKREEKYYNVDENGNLVEVSREQYHGDLED